jgi:hypothetical protein
MFSTAFLVRSDTPLNPDFPNIMNMLGSLTSRLNAPLLTFFPSTFASQHFGEKPPVSVDLSFMVLWDNRLIDSFFGYQYTKDLVVSMECPCSVGG